MSALSKMFARAAIFNDDVFTGQIVLVCGTMSGDERNAVERVDVAEYKYNQATNCISKQGSALKNWFHFWRIQVSLTRSVESMELALRTAALLIEAFNKLPDTVPTKCNSLYDLVRVWETQTRLAQTIERKIMLYRAIPENDNEAKRIFLSEWTRLITHD